MNKQDRAFLEELGDSLRVLRSERNLTQAELGERCDLHRTFIGSVERGERNISILNLCNLARALRVPLAKLFSKPVE